jgi:hypothetical protein
MYAPATDDEITGIARYLDQQLAALRAAAVGLTEAQAREAPCRSALSVGGLLKHVTHVMVGAVQRLTADPSAPARELDEAAFATYLGSFALTAGETAAGALATFDETRVAYLAAVAATDPDAATVEPPAPWDGIYDARPAKARFFLLHQVEELARHAGHADLLREQLDGTAVPRIVLSQEGAAANDYFAPYVPDPGTLGAA